MSGEMLAVASKLFVFYLHIPQIMSSRRLLTKHALKRRKRSLAWDCRRAPTSYSWRQGVRAPRFAIFHTHANANCIVSYPRKHQKQRFNEASALQHECYMGFTPHVTHRATVPMLHAALPFQLPLTIAGCTEPARHHSRGCLAPAWAKRCCWARNSTTSLTRGRCCSIANHSAQQARLTHFRRSCGHRVVKRVVRGRQVK